ncbi:GNAT family N-acetyltransferase [Altererythrobacter indicus]|uniref:GNAT family N-acetyltransferase n=1 Tax=Altericroceibacterium indicum TaxID=374177 RepID=A0A845AEG0_9SPHN|nr:GNAT family N-acetyltransferase [Altericroceibacterium indicum]MXP26936.1 GNAT family N-acetyltransferase [Altericroceibacterium indicum]
MIHLVPFAAEHFDLVCSWFTNEVEAVQWGGPSVSYPLAAQMLQAMLDEGKTNPPNRLCWMAQEDGESVGHIQLALDWRSGNATLSRVVIAPQMRGQGKGSQMLRLVTEHAFGFEAIERVELNVYAWNSVAIRTYEKLGLKLEGTRRSSASVNGERWDTCIMSVLREEWHQPLTVRRVETPEDVALCFPLMRQLRPHLENEGDFIARWQRQKATGYSLIALWKDEQPVALAGYRIQENLIYGPHLYVDDLVTDADVRGSGAGHRLLDRLKAECGERDLSLLVLDTALSNSLGHKFYYREGLLPRALRFSYDINSDHAPLPA